MLDKFDWFAEESGYGKLNFLQSGKNLARLFMFMLLNCVLLNNSLILPTIFTQQHFSVERKGKKWENGQTDDAIQDLHIKC